MSVATSFGSLLRRWRDTRKLTQLALGQEAEVSTRHISFMETGRSKPSREMVLVLASVLELPLRDRNALLLSAGYAPAYHESDLGADEMRPVVRALQFMLKQANPYAAVVLDGAWDILMSNAAAQTFTAKFVRDPAALLGAGKPNMLRLLFHPAGARDAVVNWSEVAQSVIGRVHRELHHRADDPRLASLLDEVLAYPGVPRDFRRFDLADHPALLIPIHFRHGDIELQTFSTITTLGSAQDVTLQEICIESFFPADDASDAALHALAGA
ncbi:MAG: helix-turn-helix transcriptional regulator [Myxococcota bacterium]